MIPITERVEQYLRQRETLGTGLSPSAGDVLRSFAVFATDVGARHVTTKLFLQWKARRPGAASRLTWSYRLSHDVDTSEATLHVQHAKNGRTRVLPIARCTADRLAEYRSLRDRVFGAPATPAFLVGEAEQRIRVATAENNFAWVSQKIGLREPQPFGRRGTGPRLHDLRHTMAVRTLVDWYRSGADPDRELYKLSTWLGHASPAETYWYLEAVPELLRLATERAERAVAQGGRHDDR